MSDNLYCLDAGSDTLRFMSVSGDKFYCGKNIVVMQGPKMYAYGNEGYKLFERAPKNLNMVFPVKEGSISDFRLLQDMLFSIMSQYRIKARRTSFAVAVSSELTDLEKRAFFELFYRDKDHPQDVYLVDRTLADAQGMGIPVMGSKGNLLINFGASTTEIALLSSGGVVSSKLLKSGSSSFDEELIRSLRQNYHLLISRKTALLLKEKLGKCLSPSPEKLSVTGQDMISGLPVKVEIPGSVVYDAFLPVLNRFCEEVRLAIEEIPPELSGDILENGLVLTGGGILLSELPGLLTELTGIQVKASPDPEQNTIRGLALLMSQTDRKNLPAGIISMR